MSDPVEALARSQTSAPFESILFEQRRHASGVDDLEQPDFFGDLNLDQLVESITSGHEQYSLERFFYAPLHDVDTVRYRHEVLHDLERPEVLEAITSFADAMIRMRKHLSVAQRLRYPLQAQAYFLAAVEIYCDGVGALAQQLAERDVCSRGVRGLRDYVAAACAADAPFTSLARDARELKRALAGVRYAVRINGAKVTVTKYEGEPDYSAEVEEVFAKFQQGAVKSYLVKLPDLAEMDHVEAQILAGVANLHPDVFGALAGFCDRHREYLDPVIAAFDCEVQFYVAYLELVARLRAAGLAFCYPRVSARSKQIAADEAFDLALADKLVREEHKVVTNGFRLEGRERIIVVTGPNNGGKTTFARMLGQLHHLAALGLLVPGSDARLFLPDRIFSHFEREEDIETLRGKFEDELLRVREILEHATSRSLIVMNESFSSTSLNDALFVGSEVVRLILELDALGVYVTFVDEIASLSHATVSMVTQINPDNPAERTFKVIRTPADGLAYAWAIADNYGLSYERLLERIGA